MMMMIRDIAFPKIYQIRLWRHTLALINIAEWLWSQCIIQEKKIVGNKRKKIEKYFENHFLEFIYLIFKLFKIILI